MLPSPPQEYIYGMENLVLACPWHGWEFDIRTGQALFDPSGVAVRAYPVKVEAPPDGEQARSAVPRPVETFSVDVENESVVLYA